LTRLFISPRRCHREVIEEQSTVTELCTNTFDMPSSLPLLLFSLLLHGQLFSIKKVFLGLDNFKIKQLFERQVSTSESIKRSHLPSNALELYGL
jgi:hypothetical protein